MRVTRRMRLIVLCVATEDVYEGAGGHTYVLPTDGAPQPIDVDPALAAGLIRAGDWDDLNQRRFELTTAGREVYAAVWAESTGDAA